MKTSLFSLIILISVGLFAQPTIDGTTNDASYSSSFSYTSGRDGYGSTNNIGYMKYYADGSDIYIAIESKLETNGNRIILLLDFSDYNGRSAGNALGTFTGATGIIPSSSNTNIRFGMEVDFVFEFNIGGGGGCYFDANRLGTSGLFNTGTYVGASDLSGTPFVATGLNTNVFSTANPNVAFAYNNGGGSHQGLELKIPISSLPGVLNTHTVQLQAIIANGSNPTHFSNECIPGDPGNTNPGTNPDLNSLTGSSELALPVEITSLSTLSHNRQVILNWTTATEINNAGFEIERFRLGQWQKIGFVEGNGTTNTPKEYAFADKGLLPGKYLYRLKQIDRDGAFDYSGQIEAVVSLTETDYALSQNYPNPFNPVTSFTYAVKEQQHVEIKVFNLLGQEVANLVDGLVEPNMLHSVQFNGSELSSGVYFYSLRTKERLEIRKLMLTK